MFQSPSVDSSRSEAAGLEDESMHGANGMVKFTAFGPASLSNLGPGFDALGLCIDGSGDYVAASLSEEPGIRVRFIGGDGGLLPTDPKKNTASVAAARVLELAEYEGGLDLEIEKQVPFGSGIGGSAASAVAGAWATNMALGEPFTKEQLVDAVLAGEAVASGSFHGDNVLPALFGGLVMVSSSEPSRYRRVTLPRELPLAVIAPQVQVLTKQARDILPTRIPFADSIHNASELAFLIDAFHNGDWQAVGRCIMQDRIVEPIRAELVPCYEAVKAGALEAGALGSALTGSGPAMFAVAETGGDAERVLEAMIAASQSAGIDADGFVTMGNPDGVRQAD